MSLKKRILRWLLRELIVVMGEKAIDVMICPVNGGQVPVRKTDGAIGFDSFTRAIVCPIHKDPRNENFRKLIFNFSDYPDDPKVRERVVELGGGKLGYRMFKGESVTVGLGFATAMPFPVFYWVSPRSGLSSQHGITVTNAPGTVDPDYRGEAGVLVYNRDNPEFILEKDMRVAQDIFMPALIPNFVPVKSVDDLPKTVRGAGGFGSTGLFG